METKFEGDYEEFYKELATDAEGRFLFPLQPQGGLETGRAFCEWDKEGEWVEA